MSAPVREVSPVRSWARSSSQRERRVRVSPQVIRTRRCWPVRIRASATWRALMTPLQALPMSKAGQGMPVFAATMWALAGSRTSALTAAKRSRLMLAGCSRAVFRSLVAARAARSDGRSAGSASALVEAEGSLEQSGWERERRAVVVQALFDLGSALASGGQVDRGVGDAAVDVHARSFAPAEGRRVPGPGGGAGQAGDGVLETAGPRQRQQRVERDQQTGVAPHDVTRATPAGRQARLDGACHRLRPGHPAVHGREQAGRGLVSGTLGAADGVEVGQSTAEHGGGERAGLHQAATDTEVGWLHAQAVRERRESVLARAVPGSHRPRDTAQAR